MVQQTDPIYLRPEAQPVEQWDRLTEDQQHGLLKLLRMLDEAVCRPVERKTPQRERLPWLFAETKMQLAFIDGKRGTGKTTLMTTLVGALDEPHQLQNPGNSDSAQFKETARLAEQLYHHVVPVQPLDMEPLPRDTPLMAAILARIYRAADEYGKAGQQRGGLLAEDPRDDRELHKLQQYQQRIARALDSNLSMRRGGLDPDQFAEAVMMEEDNRLALVSDLEKVLCELSQRVQKRLEQKCGNEHANGRLVFLVPIDDIDLNPPRCLELLRLLRTFSPPRELFFLLMGQYDLVESIVKLQMAAEFGTLWRGAGQLASVMEEALKFELAEVSLANVRKMIPPQARIELPPLSLSTALDFRPLGN